MPETNLSDGLAAVRAAQILTDLASLPRREAEVLVTHFGTHFEHRDGLRRVVLTGEWEVNPSAVRGAAAAEPVGVAMA